MTGMKRVRTWATYDGVNSWGSSGAKGAERGSLLSTANLASASSGDRIEWNVTQAVQNAMRDETRVDFIVGVVNAGTGNSRDALFYSNEDVMSKRAELTFVYVPVLTQYQINQPRNSSKWLLVT